jgi:hypothetical protein
MGDVERSEQAPAKIIGSAGAGTLALILAGFIAFLVAGAMLFNSFADRQFAVTPIGTAETLRPDGRAAAKLDSILAQQAEARTSLVELRRLLESHAAAPADGQATTPVAAACPPPAPRRDCRPVLDRIDRYLGTIDRQATVLLAGPAADNAQSNFGRNWEMLMKTIAETRRYVREQRPLLTAAAEPAETQEMVVLAAVAHSAPAAEPPATQLAWMKLYIVAGMFVVLGIVFIVAVVAIFTASKPATLSFATDIVKTMLGFFIGVITAFMGGPG